MPSADTAVAMGLFDGLHCGHKAVIKCAVDIANKHSGVTSAVFTFKTDTVTSKNAGNFEIILSDDLKMEFLASMGVRYIYSPDFTTVKNLDGEEFVRLVLRDRLRAKYIVCGEDFRFGRGASYNVDDLGKLCFGYGIDLTVVPSVKQNDGQRISSTLIREYIVSGNIETANKLLGYPFQLKLPVTYGNQIGRTINFPTINQRIPSRQILPKYGVYASKIELDGKEYSGITNVGVKPTVGTNIQPLAETYIIGYHGNLYGRIVKIMLLSFIRPEKKFPSIKELMKQIETDVKMAEQANESSDNVYNERMKSCEN